MAAPCPYCGSTSFEEEDGLPVCNNCGRRVDGAQQSTQAEETFGTLGKITRLRHAPTKQKTSKVLRGHKAYRLYILAWQQILYRQCHALHSLGAPPQLWTVAKSLYALMLTPLIERLDRGDSTKSGDDGDASERTGNDNTATGNGVKAKSNLQPKLRDTLGLVYLSAMIVRYPLSLGKLFDWVMADRIPFLRAIRYVPDLAAKIAPEFQEALDTTAVPDREDTQRHVYSFLKQFTAVHGIVVPALNWHLVLFEYVQRLCLPIEVYDASMRVARACGYNFQYSFDGKRRSSVAIPEIALMSVLVVAVKWVVPFHGSRGGIAMDWREWLRLQKSAEVSNKAATKAEKVEKMTGEEIDGYLDWYEDMFVASEERIREKQGDLERKILDLFPLTQRDRVKQDAKEEDVRTLVKETQRRAVLAASRDEQDMAYLVLDDVEALMKLTLVEGRTEDSPVAVFHRKSADLACSSLKQLLRAVRHTERKIETAGKVQADGEDAG